MAGHYSVVMFFCFNLCTPIAWMLFNAEEHSFFKMSCSVIGRKLGSNWSFSSWISFAVINLSSRYIKSFYSSNLFDVWLFVSRATWCYVKQNSIFDNSYPDSVSLRKVESFLIIIFQPEMVSTNLTRNFHSSCFCLQSTFIEIGALV